MPQLAVLGGFCAVGVLDDVAPLTAGRKALLLLVPCAAAAWVIGEPWVLVACWIASNAMNLLDYADGLASSVAGCSLLAAGGTVGWAGAGACAGFLLHNLPPAKAFLGDGGSLMLGAALVMAWLPQGGPLMAAGVLIPVADAGFVIARRVLRGDRPWRGGIDHLGHTLLRAGLPQRALIGAYATLTLVAAVGARVVAS